VTRGKAQRGQGWDSLLHFFGPVFSSSNSFRNRPASALLPRASWSRTNHSGAGQPGRARGGAARGRVRGRST